MVKVGIAGATGYTGIELVRILLAHPEVEIVYVGTDSYTGKALSSVYPHLKTLIDLAGAPLDPAALAKQCDLIFTALPHGLAMQMAPTLLAAGKKLIDLGADFRLKDGAAYQHWYQHAPAEATLLAQAVYGFPEGGYRSQIATATLVANPGCYPTACALGALPALKAGIIKSEGIIFDAKSGVSGAGRALALGSHFCEASENFKAYSIGGAHRHTPEIEQTLSDAANAPLIVQFTPHLVPMTRGLLATGYFSLEKLITASDVWKLYAEAYQNEPFIRLRPLGEFPETKQVRGSNFCDIGIQVDPRTGKLIVVSVIDNLVKGAAGQAVQNFNLMCGFPETLGLSTLVPMIP